MLKIKDFMKFFNEIYYEIMEKNISILKTMFVLKVYLVISCQFCCQNFPEDVTTVVASGVRNIYRKKTLNNYF